MADLAAAAEQVRAIRKATADEVPRLARALARAFYDDPVYVWLFPDASRRLRIAERGFELFFRRLWIEHDETYTTPAIAGVAVWEPPGKWKVPVGRQIAMLPAATAVHGRYTLRVLAALAALEKNHPEELHYYLPFIGVDPDWQGRGIGYALMKPICERCDADRLGAYLEATTPRNRALYERHGFEVTEEFKLGKGSPPLWRMWRAPQAAG